MPSEFHSITIHLWQSTLASEQVVVSGVHGYADGAHNSLNVHLDVAGQIVLIEGECSRVGVAMLAGGDVLPNFRWANKIAIGIPAQSKVVQVIHAIVGAFPNAEAEASGGGWAGRVQNFGPVAVPNGETGVDDCVIRNTLRSLRSEGDPPQTNDRVEIPAPTCELLTSGKELRSLHEA